MKESKPFIIELIAGIAIMGASLLIQNEYYSRIILFMSFGIIGVSVAQIIRIAYWQAPKRQKKYEAKKKEEYINSIDERKLYLKMKAGYIAYQIMTFSLLILLFILALLRVEAWIISMILALFIFQWLIGIIAFRALEHKM